MWENLKAELTGGQLTIPSIIESVLDLSREVEVAREDLQTYLIRVRGEAARCVR